MHDLNEKRLPDVLYARFAAGRERLDSVSLHRCHHTAHHSVPLSGYSNPLDIPSAVVLGAKVSLPYCLIRNRIDDLFLQRFPDSALSDHAHESTFIPSNEWRFCRKADSAGKDKKAA